MIFSNRFLPDRFRAISYREKKKGACTVKEKYIKPVVEIEELNKVDVLMESAGGPDVGPSDPKLYKNRENVYISFFDLH